MVDLSISGKCNISGSEDNTIESAKNSVVNDVEIDAKILQDGNNESSDVIEKERDGYYDINRDNPLMDDDVRLVRRHFGNSQSNIDPSFNHEEGKGNASDLNNIVNATSQLDASLTYVDCTTVADARADDEEEDTVYSGRAPVDDPYVYSDDSASLSDAYFFPQPDDDFGRVSRHRIFNDDTDSLTSGMASPGQPHHQPPLYPLATYYGSITNSNNVNSNYNHNPHSNHQMNQQYRNGIGQYHLSTIDQRATSPLWISAGSIQEDSEEMTPLQPPHMTAQSLTDSSAFLLPTSTKVLRKEKRRLARHQKRSGWTQQQEQKQREKQINRERLVNQVRGRPQNSRARDVVWKYIFIAQLIAVCSFAIYHGRTSLLAKNSSIRWTSFLPNPASATYFHQFHDERQEAVADEVIPVFPVLVQNETTNELQYNENFLNNETAKLLNQERTQINSITAGSSVYSEGESTLGYPRKEVLLIDYQNSIALLSVTGFFTLVLAYVAFGLILVLARAVIQIILIFSVLLAFAWGVIGLSLDPYGAISVLGFAVLLQTLGYAIYHWQRVPFAATNLNTALNALRCTTDIAFLGFGCLLVTFAWIMTWTVAFIGIVNSISKMEGDQTGWNQQIVVQLVAVIAVMIFSFHWTITVIKNILRVTVATVIGTWWFYPGDIGCVCTAAVAKPLWRALTKSLGSICIGSLTVQPAQLFAKLGGFICYRAGNKENSCLVGHSYLSVGRRGAKGNSDAASYHSNDDYDAAQFESNLCFSCCTRYDRCHSIALTYNRWSYTYIGMYGYGFGEAGALALKLFETREWLEVVNDGLIHTVLLMTSCVISGAAGTFAVIVEESGGYFFSSLHKPVISAFIIGSVLGYVMSNTLLLGIVGSAANTILVCFAAGPFEFDKNHPTLSREMREVWSQQVWEPSV